MNRRGVLNRSQLIIDVTSLLDVIFIVLLIVICAQQSAGEASASDAAQLIQDAETMYAEAAQIEADAETAKLVYEDRLDTMEHLSDYIMFITVAVDYAPGTPENRHIKILDTYDDEIINIELTPDDEERAFSEFVSVLSDHMDEAGGRTVVLSINTDKILYRDEQRVEQILTELGGHYDNVIFK